MDKVINDYLKTVGSNPQGEPLFRLVWSDSQHELRHGTFNEFYGSLFVRTVTGVRDVPKYPYLKERWVLEKWMPPEMVSSGLLPESNKGSYEPLYVFEDGNRNPLPLNLRVVQLIINHVHKPSRTASSIARDIVTAKEEQERKELEYDVDSLDTSPIQNALHMREGIGYGIRRR